MTASREQKIQQLIKRSREILQDSSLENGSIVASNADKDYYPRQAKDYHYVWPRDASYVCVAAQTIGLRDIQEPFFSWLKDRPEDFEKEGRLYANYSTNGRKESSQFQPDQAGSALWAIYEYYKNCLSECGRQELLVRRLADGLCADWRGKFFFHNTVDLWEEGNRKTSTKMENNHTYSLAACAHGLRCANAMISNPLWKKTSDEMTERIFDAYSKKEKRFFRNHGRIDDPNIDASLLGLVYPFEILEASDQRIKNTVAAMEGHIVVEGGVHRYQFDYYDGEGTAQEGGGAWPLLNFWMSMYFTRAKNKKKALKYFWWVIDRIGDDRLIPEQIFSDFRIGIRPLAWSHAMFVLAAKFLGYIK